MTRIPRARPTGAAPRPRAEGEVPVLADVLLRTVLPVGVLLGVSLAVYGGTGHDLRVVLQDRFPEDSEFSGLFTVLFSAALLVGAGTALGAILAVGRHGDAASRTPTTRAGLALAVLLVLVAVDDVLMVHDSMLPGVGVPEGLGLAAYGLVGVVLVVTAFRPMREEGIGLAFGAGLALLAGSLGGDVVESLLEDAAPVLSRAVGHTEDVVKFLGYAALCHVCVLLALRIAARAPGAAGRRGERRTPEPSLVTLRATGPAPRPRAADGPGRWDPDPELTAPLSLPRAR